MTSQRRRYQSPLRAAQAETTRAAVLAAATRLFENRGWNGTSMRDIATAAHVSVETVYSAVGSKVELLRQALDVAVVGDDAPVALADRSEFRRLTDGDFTERAEAAAQILGAVRVRTARLRGVLAQAAGGDAQLTDMLANSHASERESVRQGAAAVAQRDVTDREVDALFGILSTEVFLLLTGTCGWDLPAYQAEMARLIRAVLAPDGAN
jgi:AcrR family transcriptional regulator